MPDCKIRWGPDTKPSSNVVASFILVNAGRNLPVIVQFSSPALSECDAARAVPPGAFEQEVKRLCAEELTPHGLMLLYREPADGRGSDVPASLRYRIYCLG